MLKLSKSRYTLLTSVLLFYFLPLLLLLARALSMLPKDRSWALLSVSLLTIACGTLALFWVMTNRENYFKNQTLSQDESKKIPFPVENIEEIPLKNIEQMNLMNSTIESMRSEIIEYQSKISLMESELRIKAQELFEVHLEKQKIEEQIKLLKEEMANQQLSFSQQLKSHEKLIAESQMTVGEQRALVEVKHQQVIHLESKVRDLTYEIKILLQLAEIDHTPSPLFTSKEGGLSNPFSYQTEMESEQAFISIENQVQTHEDASNLLKRCVDIAQKINGANYQYHGNSRFRNLSVDNYTLDLRRLFDSLRSENGSTVLVYSQKENKILFVNNQIRILAGWNPDKFIQNFHEIILEGDVWKNSLIQLAVKNETRSQLLIKNKSGEEIKVTCLLGIVPTGLFRQHVMGVLYLNPDNVLDNLPTKFF